MTSLALSGGGRCTQASRALDGLAEANQPVAVHLAVVDGRGTWKTFVGGGTAAGF